MQVIHPSLFLVMKNFPDKKDALRQMYRSSESFRVLCHNYQKCSEALDFWKKSKRTEAPDRHREYTALMQELELEIHQTLELKSMQK